MRLDELNRTVPGRPGFDNFKQSYSSAVGWPVPPKIEYVADGY